MRRNLLEMGPVELLVVIEVRGNAETHAISRGYVDRTNP
jgi:hypothetical protein